MRMLTVLATLWGIENLVLALMSGRKIYQNPNRLDFIYTYAFLNGAFVWEDMLVFGFFHVTSVAIGLVFGDLRLFLLLFILFWTVRSAGEILYFFLQQFIQPRHHPHKITTPLQRFFGHITDQKSFILMQVFLQTILIISLFAMILLIGNWDRIGTLQVGF